MSIIKYMPNIFKNEILIIIDESFVTLYMTCKYDVFKISTVVISWPCIQECLSHSDLSNFLEELKLFH